MRNPSIYDVAIVGAGASGLVCALECARAGKQVLVLEKSPLPGRKILVTGNGRCNFTNRFISSEKYHAPQSLIDNVLKRFSHTDCLHYFAGLGILYMEENAGRYFPITGKATAITDAFKAAFEGLHVSFLYNQEVQKIKHSAVFTLYTASQQFHAKKVVLACGSCAYPQITGSQSGYTLAKQMGHSIISPLASLSGLVVKENFSRLTGIRAQVKLTFKTTQSEGEIIFTNYGINGPAALNLSPLLTRALKTPQQITINFLPQVNNPQTFLMQRLQRFPNRKPKDFFAGILHESITNLLIDFKGLRKNKSMKEHSLSLIKNTFYTIENWPITILSVRPWKEAMVAAGGVNTREINYNTFESLLCPGLFITGELLDVDGISGGFNLHFAWASGFLAAQELMKEN